MLLDLMFLKWTFPASKTQSWKVALGNVLYNLVKWLNKQLSNLWQSVADLNHAFYISGIRLPAKSVHIANFFLECFLSQVAEAVIRESVEPLLEEYRLPGITSLKFSKLSLGTVAPKIEGCKPTIGKLIKSLVSLDRLRWIQVQSLNEGQITMDIDLRGGEIATLCLLQMKDLQVFTVVRSIFQHCHEIPCIFAVVVSLLAESKSQIDYTLQSVGGSLTALPGFSDMIDVVYCISFFSELELKLVGKLTLIVMRANYLKNMDDWEIRSLRCCLAWYDFGIRCCITSLKRKSTWLPLRMRKRILEERKKLKEIGVIGSTMDALHGIVGLVGPGVGMVGIGIVGGVGLVGSGICAGAKIVESGFKAVGSGLSKAGKFVGRTITGKSSAYRKGGTSTPVNNSLQENGGAKPLPHTTT
ncbi:hypothetical protein BUALT_Bualt15G0139300 [Buddleja alternifolia]|uniref:Uncharacterized protein n=1 Tax=Buddleja alternifolia TaxID=168488 RepID=A0AAV6WQY8_9LAMI|nr:hypothetical protein BUALT_Bualt15G0139300 [Buddleja alternifolia]